MTIQYSAIIPHGFNLIDDIYPNQGKIWDKLIGAMKTIALEIYEADPEVIIIASPHNLRIDGQIGIITSEWLEGSWWNEDHTDYVHLKLKCDREFGKKIYDSFKLIDKLSTIIYKLFK